MVDRIQRRNTHMRISPMFLYNVCVCIYICKHIVEGSLYGRENVI